MGKLTGLIILGLTCIILPFSYGGTMDISGIELKPAFSRNTFARDEENVKLDWVVKNNTEHQIEGRVWITAYEEPLMEKQEIKLKKGESVILKTEFSPCRFPIGTTDIIGYIESKDGKSSRIGGREVYLGPWRSPERLPVMVWPRIKETACIKETLDSGINTTSFSSIINLDDIMLLGGYGGIHLHTHGMDDRHLYCEQ